MIDEIIDAIGVEPYFRDDAVVIYHADCRTLLPKMPKVDLVLTDPPYGAQTHAGAQTGANGGQPLIDFDSMTVDEVRDCFSLIQPRRWLVSFMEWRHLAQMEVHPPTGLRFVRFGIWRKPNGAPQFTGDRPATGWEAIGIFHAQGAMRWNGGGSHAVWVEPKIESDHPTGKPPRLVKRLTTLFSDVGETILDPFMGSGTTLRAAKDLGRYAIGIEIEEKYCEIAAKRMAQMVMPLSEPCQKGKA